MNKIVKRMPFYSGLSELHHAIDKLLEPTWFENNWISQTMSSDWIPTIDVKEEPTRYIVRADIPGVDPKTIDISLENGVLMIKGHKESEKKEERENYLHLERSQGTFYRSLPLPNAADADHVQAKSKNGVLEITIPKVKQSKSQKIQIEEE